MKNVSADAPEATGTSGNVPVAAVTPTPEATPTPKATPTPDVNTYRKSDTDTGGNTYRRSNTDTGGNTYRRSNANTGRKQRRLLRQKTRNPMISRVRKHQERM